MNKPLTLAFCAFAFTLMNLQAATPPPAKDTNIYELRIYYSPAGKLDELHTRFRDHTMKLFEKHGMKNIGYWVPLDNSQNKLIYLLAYPSPEAREQSWKEFMADQEWQKVWKASETNGKLVEKVESTFLRATDYSPEVKPEVAGEPRVFELRTYKATPGKLENLNTRFRDHTLTLFKKHGMQNFGYWVPADKAKGGQDTLIYILAHSSKEAADASFKNFREDPDWVKARKESEEKAGGSLTAPNGVTSVFMKATDYSPTK